MRILRAADRRPAPWKNGGGETFEVFAFPQDAGLSAFDWRISIARIGASGPFSHFPGVVRWTAMLEGEIELKVAGQADVRLTPQSGALAYPGDVETYGELIGADALDLNVMVRRGACGARLTRRSGSQTLVRPSGVTWMVLVALEPLSFQADETLHRFDAAVWNDGGPIEIAGQGDFWLAEILMG